MKDRGLMYVAFGDEYQELAVYTISYSQQFTDLPIVVLINGEVNPKWEGMENITIHHFDEPQKQNRNIKTQMCRFTPFAETLYLDCDSVIRKPGIEKVFDMMNEHEMLLNMLFDWQDGDRVVKLYKKAMDIAGVGLSMKVWNGAFICWRNSERVIRFFKVWNQLWKKTGRGREMPALACALNKTGIDIKETCTIREKLFAPDYRNLECLVQHNYNSNGAIDFFSEFGLPKIKRPWKPFDTDPSDFSWVDSNEPIHS